MSERAALVDGWLRYGAGDDSAIDAVGQMVDCCRSFPDVALDIILELLTLAPSEEARGLIGSGPLEDLVAFNGHKIIDRLEAEAAKSPELRHLLGGIYRLDTPLDVWRRIVAISGREREMDSR